LLSSEWILNANSKALTTAHHFSVDTFAHKPLQRFNKFFRDTGLSTNLFGKFVTGRNTNRKVKKFRTVIVISVLWAKWEGNYREEKNSNHHFLWSV